MGEGLSVSVLPGIVRGVPEMRRKLRGRKDGVRGRIERCGGMGDPAAEREDRTVGGWRDERVGRKARCAGWGVGGAGSGCKDRGTETRSCSRRMRPGSRAGAADRRVAVNPGGSDGGAEARE